MEGEPGKRCSKMERIKEKGDTDSMNENLSQMVKDTPAPEQGVVFSENDLDLPVEEVTTIELPAVEIPNESTVTPPNAVPITTLSTWFENNCNGIENINQVKVAIRGVDGNKTLIMAVNNEDEEKDANGNEKRTLRVFDNADTTPVLNLLPISMNVYNNGFKIVYQQNNTFIKTYGVRTGLICTLCNNIDGKMVPYKIVRVKKKDVELEIPVNQAIVTPEKLAAPADLESLQLLYKQISKAIETLSTNQSVLDWLLERQNSVTDINHHLQIDDVIINILK